MTGKDKEQDQRARDWDREMREVDKLLARLPAADPSLGRGDPTMPRAHPATPGGGGRGGGPVTARDRLSTWFRVGLGVVLGLGMVMWPYSHVCGLKLILYMVGSLAVVVAGVWGSLASWKRRMGLAHLLSLGLLLWGLALAAGVVLPRIGYARTAGIWFCPEPPTTR